jgi:hypothetical protein
MFVCPKQKKLTYELNFFLTQHFKLEQKFPRGPTFAKEIESWNENLHLGVSTRSYFGGNRFVANENALPSYLSVFYRLSISSFALAQHCRLGCADFAALCHAVFYKGPLKKRLVYMSRQ